MANKNKWDTLVIRQSIPTELSIQLHQKGAPKRSAFLRFEDDNAWHMTIYDETKSDRPQLEEHLVARAKGNTEPPDWEYLITTVIESLNVS